MDGSWGVDGTYVGNPRKRKHRRQVVRNGQMPAVAELGVISQPQSGRERPTRSPYPYRLGVAAIVSIAARMAPSPRPSWSAGGAEECS